MKGESTSRLGLFRRVCPAAALAFLALDTPALAGLDTGAAAYNNGDYSTALHELSPPAEIGDAEALVEQWEPEIPQLLRTAPE